MVNLLLLHDRRAPSWTHTAPIVTGNAASVNHLLWRCSLSETSRGATFCQRMRYLGEVIVATVVSVTLWRLLTFCNVMRTDSQGDKMAPDSHLWIHHRQEIGLFSCVSLLQRFVQTTSSQLHIYIYVCNIRNWFHTNHIFYNVTG